MGKIIKKSVEKVEVNKQSFSLGMKGEFKIEFANDSFGPYKYKFEREDCYFNDGIEDRGTFIFPLKNKQFNNTEIFLENNDIVIAVGERPSLKGESKKFIDIINIKTEKKYRLFTPEVNLIFNSEDKLIINAKEEGVFKTFVLKLDTLEKLEEKEETLLAFFKLVYCVQTEEWFVLDFSPTNDREYREEDYKEGNFVLQLVKMQGKPNKFDRVKFKLKTDSTTYDIWEESII